MKLCDGIQQSILQTFNPDNKITSRRCTTFRGSSDLHPGDCGGDGVAVMSYPRTLWRVWWRLRGNIFLTCRDHKMTVSDKMYFVSQTYTCKKHLTS